MQKILKSIISPDALYISNVSCFAALVLTIKILAEMCHCGILVTYSDSTNWTTATVNPYFESKGHRWQRASKSVMKQPKLECGQSYGDCD